MKTKIIKWLVLLALLCIIYSLVTFLYPEKKVINIKYNGELKHEIIDYDNSYEIR